MTMKTRRLYSTLILSMALLTFPSCEGLFEGVYDEYEEEVAETVESTTEIDDGTTPVDEGYGFIEANDNSGTVYINSTDYYTWTLIDFHNLRCTYITIDSETLEDPFTDDMVWDIACHRWDVRTNGGAGLETSYTSLDQVTSIPTGTYVEDEWTTETISADMTNMLSGDIGYAEGYVNFELSKWMDVDTNNMPPTYTPSNLVYSVQMSDGTYAAIILADYLKTGGTTKGYLTIDYIYPIE